MLLTADRSKMIADGARRWKPFVRKLVKRPPEPHSVDLKSEFLESTIYGWQDMFAIPARHGSNRPPHETFS